MKKGLFQDINGLWWLIRGLIRPLFRGGNIVALGWCGCCLHWLFTCLAKKRIRWRHGGGLNVGCMEGFTGPSVPGGCNDHLQNKHQFLVRWYWVWWERQPFPCFELQRTQWNKHWLIWNVNPNWRDWSEFQYKKSTCSKSHHFFKGLAGKTCFHKQLHSWHH